MSLLDQNMINSALKRDFNTAVTKHPELLTKASCGQLKKCSFKAPSLVHIETCYC